MTPTSEATDVALPVYRVLVVALVGALAWWLGVSFVQRRMGMTRLLVCLGCVAAPFAWPLAVLAVGGAEALAPWPDEVERTFLAHRAWAAVAAATPLAGAVVLVLVRPGDLLRWAPTGTAWPIYRSLHARTRADRPRDVPSGSAARARSGSSTTRWTSRPRRRWLDTWRRQAGASSGIRRAPPTRPRCCSSRARAAASGWPPRPGVCRRRRSPSSARRSPCRGELEALWRRQWIDYRRWRAPRAEDADRLPGIPESLEGLRVPRPVAVVHALACAHGALLFALGGVSAPPEPVASETITAPEVLGGLTAACGLAVAVAASRFLRRATTARRAGRWLVAAALAGLALGVPCVLTLAARDGLGPGLVATAVALGVLPVLAWRRRASVRFWLPAAWPARADRAQRVGAPRNWRTTLAFTLAALVWMALVDPGL